MAGEACNECPYANDCEDGKGLFAGAAHLTADALELLKEQEPRVMTFDELLALPHGIETDVPVVMETKTPVGKWDGGSMCQWKPAGFVQEMVQDHRWYNREHYGEYWRVWNVRPTVAQRKAVKWDA